MFKIKRPTPVKTGLMNARDEALLELQGYAPTEEDYKKIMTHVAELTKLIKLEKDERLSPNTIAIILGNAFTAVAVIAYESKNVWTSKVQNFMVKVTK